MTTKRVEKHLIKKSHQWFNYCDEITNTSRKLFNTGQYTQRQSFFYGHGYLSQARLDKCFQKTENYDLLPAKVAQLVLQQCANTWRNYFKVLEAYHKDPSKFTGKPNIPGYTKDRNLVKFNTYTPGQKEKPTFSGKRFKRSWYKASDGSLIHADVNGAFNIGRKVIPTSFDLLKSMLGRDRGCLVVHPRRITPVFPSSLGSAQPLLKAKIGG